MAIDPITKEGEWTVSVDEMQDLFEISDLYDRWVDFKKYVLVQSVTSLKVDWEVAGKEGKSISDIRFIGIDSEQLTLFAN